MFVFLWHSFLNVQPVGMEVVGHGHAPPPSSGCSVPILPAELAMCPCMSQQSLAAVSSVAAWTTYHLTQGTTPTSSFSLVCSVTDCRATAQTSPLASANTNLSPTCTLHLMQPTHTHARTHTSTHMLPSTPESYQISLKLQSPRWGWYSLFFCCYCIYACLTWIIIMFCAHTVYHGY